MEECKPNNLVGKLAYEKVIVANDFDLSEIGINKDVAEKINGDGFHPLDCNVPKGQSVAIIFPFRDTATKGMSIKSQQVACPLNRTLALILVRAKQLYVFLHHMIPIFVRQNIRFKLFLINQMDGGLFNRAKLLNIGFQEGEFYYSMSVQQNRFLKNR